MQRTPNSIPNSEPKIQQSAKFKKFRPPARVEPQTDTIDDEECVPSAEPVHFVQNIPHDVITEEEVDDIWENEEISRKRKIVEVPAPIKKSRDSRSSDELLKLFE